jgi:hypothetical protein
MQREFMANGKSARPIIFLIVVIAALVAFIIFRPRPKYLEPLPTTGTLSSAIDIDVYIDSSGSMENYLVGGVGANTFHEFLDDCEFALRSGVSQGGWDLDKRTIRFWKFGPKGGPVRLDTRGAGDEGVLRELASHPEQFDAPSTPIESAIDAMPPDLFESGGRGEEAGKLEKPEEHLAHRFLAGNQGAVAVFGVRSPYDLNGALDDLPGQNDEKVIGAATSMPFYILIGGDNAADVRHAQGLLTTGRFGAPLQQANQEHRLFAAFFSRNPGRYDQAGVTYDAHVRLDSKDGEYYFSATPNPQPREKEAGSAIPAGDKPSQYSARVTSFEANFRDGIALLEMRKRAFRQNLVGVSWQRDNVQSDSPIWRTPGAEIAQPSQWEIRAFDCPVPRKSTDTECRQNHAVDTLKGLRICNSPLGTMSECQTEGYSNPALAVLIDRNSFSVWHPLHYLLEFDELSTANTQAANFDPGSELMRKWSMTPDEVQALLAKPEGQRKFPASGEGHGDDRPGKTPNLDQFLSALDGSVMSTPSGSGTARVVLSTYFLYLNVR